MNLTNVWVNIAGSSSVNVLRDGSGYVGGDGRIRAKGTVVGDGPQVDGPDTYVVGSSEGNYNDVRCVSRIDDSYFFMA
jgi:hypothetical protein